MTEPILTLRELADVEEIHTATGDTCLILKVRCSGPANLERLLSRIQEIKGYAPATAMWCWALSGARADARNP